MLRLSFRNIRISYIQKCDNKWCVFSESGKKLGTHDSEESAKSQLAAIHSNQHKG